MRTVVHPPGKERTPTFFDLVMKQIMGGSGVGGPNAQVEGSMIASKAEDQMLKGALGSTRKRGEGDVGGSYLLAKYPGYEHEIWKAERGFAPLGQSSYKFFGEDQQQKELREEEQRVWANRQRMLLGMPERVFGTGTRRRR